MAPPPIPQPLSHRSDALAILLAAVLVLCGCTGQRPGDEVVESRELLGTAVSITAFGTDKDGLEATVAAAFARMEEVDAALDAYDPTSAVAAFNEDPYAGAPLPDEFGEILIAVRELGLGEEFSASMLGVLALYEFGEEGRVPDDAELTAATEAARDLAEADGLWRFGTPDPDGAPSPGLDPGGAAKGLALDRAADALAADESVEAALVTAGSTTVAIGTKPDGTPWRVGVEDPRDTSTIVAVFESAGEDREHFAVSTSGDYQQFFESDGVRYHHILDPATGRPARGTRSVTVGVVGMSGLEADILSTALFVAGPARAAQIAEDLGVALYTVDDEGRARVTPGPPGGPSIVQEAEPTS